MKTFFNVQKYCHGMSLCNNKEWNLHLINVSRLFTCLFVTIISKEVNHAHLHSYR